MRNYPTGLLGNPAIDAWNLFDPRAFEATNDISQVGAAKESITDLAAKFPHPMKGRIKLTLLAKLDEELDLPGEPPGCRPDSWTYAFAGSRAEVVEAMIGDATVDDDGFYTWGIPALTLEEIPGKGRRRRYRRRLRGVLRQTGRYQNDRLRKMSTEALIRGIHKHRERFGR